MDCPECGKENVDNSRLCSGCGAKLEVGGNARGGSASGSHIRGGAEDPLCCPGKRTAVIGASVIAGAAVLVLVILLAVFVAAPAFKEDAGGNQKGKSGTAVTLGAASGKGETEAPDDGGEVGELEKASDAAYAPFKTGYADIVNANRSKRLYLSDDWEYNEYRVYSRSQVIEHDSYYEVTNCCILSDAHYALSVMEGKGVGDAVWLEDNEYRITDIIPWYSGEGENIRLVYASDGDDVSGFHVFARNYSWDYYILIDEDDDRETDTLYKGSVYFSKSCRIEAKDPDHGFENHGVNVKDYLTKDKQEVGAEHGLGYNYGLRLWGDFYIDSSGLITVYEEYFES